MAETWGVPSVEQMQWDWASQDKPTSLAQLNRNGWIGGNSVDILFVSTHGRVDETDAALSLWPRDAEILTNSDRVRFGEFPGRLSVLALESCWVLSGSRVPRGDASVDGSQYDGSDVETPVASGWLFNRWGNVFKGWTADSGRRRGRRHQVRRSGGRHE